jgi:Na+-transporting NADH:ubiquinone oxidoreductase subunit NqrC
MATKTVKENHMSVMIVDAQTGVVIERERNPQEQAQYEIDAAASEAAATAAAAKAEADAAATAAAIAHAKSLGFTDAMIAVMYPNLGAQNE